MTLQLRNPSQNLKLNLKLRLGKSYKAHPLSLLYSLSLSTLSLSLKLAVYSATAENAQNRNLSTAKVKQRCKQA